MIQTINDIAQRCWAISEAKGFHDSGRQFPEVVALIHSEVSEALEADRKGEPIAWMDGPKPEGVAVELLDALIRILDYLGDPKLDFDVEDWIERKLKYNESRPFRHGKEY